MPTTDELHDMSDDELDEAFKAARASEESGEGTFTEDDTVVDDTVVDDSENDADGTPDEIFDEDVAAEDEGDELTDDVDADDEDPEADDKAEEEKDPADAEDKDPEAKAEDSPEVVKAPAKHMFKANSKEYEFTEEEIMQQFPRVFGQAMDYTKKLQTIQPWRKTIDALEQAKLKHEDINLMIDVFKGDKDAIASVLKRTGVETLDIDTEQENYVVKDYGRNDNELAVSDVIDTIKGDAEYTTTHRVLTKDWDEKSWTALSSDPSKIKQLHVDVKSGMFDKLQPFAEKYRVYDEGKQSDLDYYMMAAKDYYAEQHKNENLAQQQKVEERAKATAAQTQLTNAKQQQKKRDAAKQDASRRKAAAPSGRAAGRGTVTDYLTASEEDFEDWYERLSDE
jgi:hypothetical protein